MPSTEHAQLEEDQIRRLREDLLDTLDEEFEMELDDRLSGGDGGHLGATGASRAHYFRELLRLQGELVKLQDWVVANRQRVVILFEGRDAARVEEKSGYSICHFNQYQHFRLQHRNWKNSKSNRR